VTLTVRLDVKPAGRVGPGKIDLLEQIDECGSIAAAARTMRMSYRRAWELVDEIGRCFGQPVVTAQIGGSGGGGATLTPLGHDLVTQYRAIERKARHAATRHLAWLQSTTVHRG
jgi:molybdate transport system regulatory protein